MEPLWAHHFLILYREASAAQNKIRVRVRDSYPRSLHSMVYRRAGAEDILSTPGVTVCREFRAVRMPPRHAARSHIVRLYAAEHTAVRGVPMLSRDRFGRPASIRYG